MSILKSLAEELHGMTESESHEVIQKSLIEMHLNDEVLALCPKCKIALDKPEIKKKHCNICKCDIDIDSVIFKLRIDLPQA